MNGSDWNAVIAMMKEPIAATLVACHAGNFKMDNATINQMIGASANRTVIALISKYHPFKKNKNICLTGRCSLINLIDE